MKRMLGVVLMVVLCSTAALGQSWISGRDFGVATIETSMIAPNTFSWKLTNTSTAPCSVLLWTLKPFNIRAPLDTMALTGWTWNGSEFSVSAVDKYETPPAIAPGQSLSFIYHENPSGSIINPDTHVPGGGLGFVSEFGVVTPGSGSLDGSRRWTPSVCNFGSGSISLGINQVQPVPDSSTLMLAMFGGGGLLLRFMKKKVSVF